MPDTPDKPQTPEQWEERIGEAKARGEHFQRLHAEGTINYELRKAAEDAGAFSADQIVIFLKGKSRLVEADSKQVVRIVAVGNDGQEVHHSPAQAIWHMRQNKDNDNLFRDTMTQTPTLAPSSTIDARTDLRKLLKNMSFEQYLKLREERPEVLGLKPLPKKGR